MDDNKNKNKKLYEKITPSSSHTDPLGMYTGLPEDKYAVPEQDADDL